MTYWFF